MEWRIAWLNVSVSDERFRLACQIEGLIERQRLQRLLKKPSTPIGRLRDESERFQIFVHSGTPCLRSDFLNSQERRVHYAAA
jgi:hypothetical protein